jgi:type VI secretion system protein ImpG
VGNPGGDFDLEGQPEVATICALDRYTDPIRIPLRQSLHWRLIAHLGLNYVSVYDAGLEALQEILTLHDAANANQRHIAGITAFQRQQVVRRLASMDRHSVCEGIEVTLQCDEAAYAPGELFLFASVLERFFGLCAPINSFSQLVVTTDQRIAQQQEPLHIWLPRAGEQVLRT